MPSHSRLCCAALAGLVLTAAPAHAQEDAGGDPYGMQDEIVVTGRGLDPTPSVIAYSTITLDSDQLQSTASGRIEDALASIAGFQQFRRSDSRSSNPTAQGVTLRALSGNATSRALLLLDGVPMVDPFFGHVPLSALSPNQLGVIRVTRGGGSGPFGAGALAGTIELESRDASELGTASGELLVDDRGETEAEASLAPKWDSGFAAVSGRWDRGQGFWTTPVDQRVPASVRAAYDSWSANARAVQSVGPDMQLQMRGLAYEDRRTLRFAGADTMQQGQDLSLRLVGRGDWQFDVLGYAQWRDFSNVVVSSSTYRPVLDQRSTPATGLGGKIEVRPPLGWGHVLRLGADFRRSAGDLAEYRFNAGIGAANGSRFAGGVNSDLGLFAEHDWTIGMFLLTGGLRADRWTIGDGYHRNLDASGGIIEDSRYSDRAGWDLSWRAGATADVSRGVRLRLAGYTGLRLPTLNELYRPFVVFPVTTDANAALKNERLEGYEAGIDVTLSRDTRFSFTAFDNRVENAIANVSLTETERQRQNLDAIHARGIELSARMERGDFGVFGTLGYTDAHVEATGAQSGLNGNRPAQTPKWSASGTISWKPMEDWKLSATLRHTAAQFEGDQQDDVLPAVTTLDLFASVALVEKLNLVARAENVLDETVLTRNQAGSVDLGTLRTFWLGFRFGY